MFRRGYVDTAEGQVHYREARDGPRAPLVLVHMAASSAAFEPLMRELDGRVPTIAFDTMNYGESYRTDHEPTMKYVAEVMHEAVRNLGLESYHVIGHHSGASIAVEIAADPASTVRSLILNGPTYATPEERARNMEVLAYPNPISVKGTQVMWAWSRAKDYIGVTPGAEPEWAARIMHREVVDTLHAGENWHWGYQAVLSHDLVEAMKHVTCPILLVGGRRDPSIRFHERVARDIPGVRSHEHPDGGVYYPESHPEDLAPRIVEFVGSVEKNGEAAR